jgi:hypothetical protein
VKIVGASWTCTGYRDFGEYDWTVWVTRVPLKRLGNPFYASIEPKELLKEKWGNNVMLKESC